MAEVTVAAVTRRRTLSKPPRRRIARLFTVSLMSDFKWRKMISMLGPHNADVHLEQAIVKFIEGDAEQVVPAPKPNHLRTPKGFIEMGQFGPVPLVSIEWLEYPAFAEYENRPPSGTGRVPPTRVAQDLDRAEAVIAKLGKYPVERTARGLRVIGHLRRRDAG